MKTTLTTSQAANILLEDENANWSQTGAFALVEYLEELEEDCGMEIELDHVAIRCDFSEYDSLKDWSREYFGAGNEPRDLKDADEIREYIRERGDLIEFEGGVIVSSF